MNAAQAPGSTELAALWAALAEVPDPEIPAISLVDLGIVRSVVLDDDRVRIELLPTFVGCPALEVMRDAVRERLAGFRPSVEVGFTYTEPWTSDRITPRGRAALRSAGFAPPAPADDPSAGSVARSDRGSLPIVQLDPAATCPWCDSTRTRLESAFGPTLCRSIRYCLDCRQSFEQFKVV